MLQYAAWTPRYLSVFLCQMHQTHNLAARKKKTFLQILFVCAQVV